MDIKSFTKFKTGRLIPLTGMPGITHSFVPDPLPPTLKYNKELWEMVIEANKELARLDGIGKHLPNPDLLLTPLQRREAQKSSSLEGTFATPEQLALFEIDPEDSSLSEDRQSVREVFNYMRASQYHDENKGKMPISLRFIRELHRILLENVRGAQATPGEFRRTQNQIGYPARYVPPPINELSNCLDQFEKYIYVNKQNDPLIEVFLLHYQFEAIHPFKDGNGRVGRLLLSILIKEWCKLNAQWLYMSPYFELNRDEYIDRLFYVSSRGEWVDWLIFCLKGVVTQATDAQDRCSLLVALKDEYHKKLLENECPGRLNDVVDNLFVQPVMSTSILRKKYDVSVPTALSDIGKLVDLRILSEITPNRKRDKRYYCKDIINITFK